MSDPHDAGFLDEDERQMAQDIEQMDISELKKPSEKQQAQLRQAAHDTLRKRESKMNIRIDAGELQRLKERADREGLPYQTLVKSVLHKYLTGQLVERSNHSPGS